MDAKILNMTERIDHTNGIVDIKLLMSRDNALKLLEVLEYNNYDIECIVNDAITAQDRIRGGYPAKDEKEDPLGPCDGEGSGFGRCND